MKWHEILSLEKVKDDSTHPQFFLNGTSDYLILRFSEMTYRVLEVAFENRERAFHKKRTSEQCASPHRCCDRRHVTQGMAPKHNQTEILKNVQVLDIHVPSRLINPLHETGCIRPSRMLWVVVGFFSSHTEKDGCVTAIY